MVLGAQLSGHTPGEMQEELSPEGIQAPNLCRTFEHCWVKWLKANKEKEWLQFDADTILEVTASTRHALHPGEPQSKQPRPGSGEATIGCKGHLIWVASNSTILAVES